MCFAGLGSFFEKLILCVSLQNQVVFGRLPKVLPSLCPLGFFGDLKGQVVFVDLSLGARWSLWGLSCTSSVIQGAPRFFCFICYQRYLKPMLLKAGRQQICFWPCVGWGFTCSASFFATTITTTTTTNNHHDDNNKQQPPLPQGEKIVRLTFQHPPRGVSWWFLNIKKTSKKHPLEGLGFDLFASKAQRLAAAEVEALKRFLSGG